MSNVVYAESLLGLRRKGLLMLLVLVGAGSARAEITEPEDSPLYASSRQKAFADMADRDRGVWLPRGSRGTTPGQAGSVIVVEGTRWRSAPDTMQPLAGAKARPQPGGTLAKGPRPLDITTDLSCTWPTMCTTCGDLSCTWPTMCTTCAATTCGASCDATPTCRGYPTCHVPIPTQCIYATCTGGSTCNAGQTTCVGVSCTEPGATCVPGATCDASGTCTGTCVPANCPVSLFNVQVPRVGEIQMSFASSSYLSYTLQYCTNLAGAQWMTVGTVLGNGGTMSVSHTNEAAVSCYRLLVQSP